MGKDCHTFGREPRAWLHARTCVDGSCVKWSLHSMRKIDNDWEHFNIKLLYTLYIISASLNNCSDNLIMDKMIIDKRNIATVCWAPCEPGEFRTECVFADQQKLKKNTQFNLLCEILTDSLSFLSCTADNCWLMTHNFSYMIDRSHVNKHTPSELPGHNQHLIAALHHMPRLNCPRFGEKREILELH